MTEANIAGQADEIDRLRWNANQVAERLRAHRARCADHVDRHAVTAAITVALDGTRLTPRQRDEFWRTVGLSPSAVPGSTELADARARVAELEARLVAAEAALRIPDTVPALFSEAGQETP